MIMIIIVIMMIIIIIIIVGMISNSHNNTHRFVLSVVDGCGSSQGAIRGPPFLQGEHSASALSAATVLLLL